LALFAWLEQSQALFYQDGPHSGTCTYTASQQWEAVILGSQQSAILNTN